MTGTALARNGGFAAPRRSHRAAWLGRATWLRSPRLVAAVPGSAGAICRDATRRAAEAADLIAVQALRLTVLAVIVWGGSIMVRSVTGALQEVAGHTPVSGLQRGASR